MRVLLVEDSTRLRASISTALRHSGYVVDATGEGNEGLWYAQSNAYDTAILDIMLPGMDGLSILRRIRADGNDLPVLLLTARDTVADRVRGLQTGADDYLVKPFALEELLARVDALSRRRYRKPSPMLRVADLVLDTSTKQVARGGQPIDLAPREFRLLQYLMMRVGHVVTHGEIERHIYDDLASPESNVVEAAMYALRRKLANRPEAVPLIHTRRGLGYVLEEPGP